MDTRRFKNRRNRTKEKEKMIPVEEWMTTPVRTIEPDKSIMEAAKIMAKNRIGALIVVENNKPVGVITERDILDKVVAKAKDPRELRVKKIMTKKVYTLHPKAPIIEATKMMKKHGCRRILIVDENNKPLGILTSRDLIDLIAVE